LKPKYLRVDPTACAGHGLCAELLPEMVRLDDWGYPILDVSPIPPRLLHHAQRAVSFCPTLALAIRADPATGRPAESDARAKLAGSTARLRPPSSQRTARTRVRTRIPRAKSVSSIDSSGVWSSSESPGP
jgi:ferredoxin